MITLKYVVDSLNFKKEISFENWEDLFQKTDVIQQLPELNNQFILNNVEGGISVLYPYNHGEDFLIQFTSSKLKKLAGADFDDLKGKSYSNSFPLLNKLGFIKSVNYVFNNQKSLEGSVKIYKDDILVTKYDHLIVLEDKKIFVINKNIVTVHLFSEKEKKLFNSPRYGILILGENEEILRVNKTFCKLSGYNFKELKELGLNNLILDSQNLDSHLSGVGIVISKLLNDEILVSESNIKILTKSNEVKWIKTHTTKMVNTENLVQSVILDITENHQIIDNALNFKNNLLSLNSLSNQKIAICSWENNKFTWTNEIYNILEISSSDYDDSVDLLYKFACDEYHEEFKRIFNLLSDSNNDFNIPIRIKTALGSIKDLMVYSTVNLNDEGKVNSFVSFVQDITTDVLHEKKVKQLSAKNKMLIDEKESLLHEVHHRVKNNMQIILSLLNLELRFRPEDLPAVVEETRNRLNSMILIHENIYQNNTSSNLNMEKYIRSEIKSLLKKYNSDIFFEFDLDEITLDLDKAVPLGLVINELTLNVINHAFINENKSSTLYVSLKYRSIDDMVILTFIDNGKGMPDDFDFESYPSLGITIINGLIKQMEGNILILDTEGAGFEINFKR